MTVCLRERIREIRRRAVAAAEAGFKGTFDHARRQEWGESRKVQGWSQRLVETAICGGPFSLLREVVRDGPCALARVEMTTSERQRTLRAADAFAKIDSGLSLETRQPRYGDDTIPLQRRTYAPSRLRLPV